ncbi:hypothetical protein HD554DRAFT_2043227, partial [Boletus coccyginus]
PVGSRDARGGETRSWQRPASTVAINARGERRGAGNDQHPSSHVRVNAPREKDEERAMAGIHPSIVTRPSQRPEGKGRGAGNGRHPPSPSTRGGEDEELAMTGIHRHTSEPTPRGKRRTRSGQWPASTVAIDARGERRGAGNDRHPPSPSTRGGRDEELAMTSIHHHMSESTPRGKRTKSWQWPASIVAVDRLQVFFGLQIQIPKFGNGTECAT